MPIPEFPETLRRYGDLRVRRVYRTSKAQGLTRRAEQRTQLAMNPLYVFEIDYRPLLPPPLDAVMAQFHDQVRGDALSFWFLDWTTPIATPGTRLGETLGYGNGARVLFKVHEDRLASATIYVDGVAQDQGGPTPEVVVDPDTGLVTFTTPPAADARITADVVGGWFRCRFEGDELPGDRVRPHYWRYGVTIVQVGTGVPWLEDA